MTRISQLGVWVLAGAILIGGFNSEVFAQRTQPSQQTRVARQKPVDPKSGAYVTKRIQLRNGQVRILRVPNNPQSLARFAAFERAQRAGSTRAAR